jgi:transcriptional regulator with XRE-family HTH domain
MRDQVTAVTPDRPSGGAEVGVERELMSLVETMRLHAAHSGIVDVWTGRHANALRVALRLTHEGFAHHLGAWTASDQPEITQGHVLKQARERKGWSQSKLATRLREVADQLGRSSDLPYNADTLIAYISYFENGRRTVSSRLRPIYLQALDLGFIRIDPATVTEWDTHPHLIPVLELQRALDNALTQAPDTVHVRFALLLSRTATTDTEAAGTGSARTLHVVPNAPGKGSRTYDNPARRAMISDLMRKLLDEQSMSLTKLARSTFFDKGYLSRIRSGEKPLSLKVAAALDHALSANGEFTALASGRKDNTPAVPAR